MEGDEKKKQTGQKIELIILMKIGIFREAIGYKCNKFTEIGERMITFFIKVEDVVINYIRYLVAKDVLGKRVNKSEEGE